MVVDGVLQADTRHKDVVKIRRRGIDHTEDYTNICRHIELIPGHRRFGFGVIHPGHIQPHEQLLVERVGGPEQHFLGLVEIDQMKFDGGNELLPAGGQTQIHMNIILHLSPVYGRQGKGIDGFELETGHGSKPWWRVNLAHQKRLVYVEELQLEREVQIQQDIHPRTNGQL